MNQYSCSCMARQLYQNCKETPLESCSCHVSATKLGGGIRSMCRTLRSWIRQIADNLPYTWKERVGLLSTSNLSWSCCASAASSRSSSAGAASAQLAHLKTTLSALIHKITSWQLRTKSLSNNAHLCPANRKVSPRSESFSSKPQNLGSKHHDSFARCFAMA